ncbi:hypothetical protein D7X94_13250 [Acutalibacter sp. 1XD8-33]|uniref:hypothetical protein n=1 Tax=Acutalibacter sp. 1XD8-33 TaxID=2320081 RepID=UPI000EA212F5|nr:hypothetical protein [Acutalibacter sp. 1XD8-33]RKJ39197.1 hypothetical protein D7X94_13250 [Acutalibacter sp. 1XD8-33]
MLYCAQCRRICEEGRKRCPACRSGKLRPVAGRDFVLLQKTDLYGAQRLGEALSAGEIEYETQDANAGQSYFNFDGDSMPTDQNVYVRYADWDKAGELAAKADRKREEDVEEDAGEETPPSAKRIAAEVLSAAAFLVLIMLAVYGADALANWLKGLLGI